MDSEKLETMRNQLRQDETFRNPKPQFRPHQFQGHPDKPKESSRPQQKSASPNEVVKFAITIYEWIDELFKSFGIITGGIATSLADWIFGAATMTVLLSNYKSFAPWMKWVAGGIFSLALWGIQIIMWRIILTGRIKKISNSSTLHFWMYVAVFIGVGIMKFGDDFSDIMGVYWLIKDNPMQAVLSISMYKTLLMVIFFLTWAICGFAEIFVALSINLLKDNKQNN